MEDIKNSSFNLLLLNFSCNGPHSEHPTIYSYEKDDAFFGVLTSLAVFNSLAVIPTAILNGLIILSFIQQKKLRTTSNRLLFSICLADFIVGAVVEPVVAAHMIYITNGKHHCGLSNLLIYLVPVLIVITMVTHMGIAAERYVATHYPNSYPKIFQKRYLTWFIVFSWSGCLLCFIVPFLTGDPILGTRIIVVTILLSIAACAYCYISIYQDHKWQHGKPKAKIQGPYIVRETKTKDRTVEEIENLRTNIRVSSFYFKLFICMLITYILNLLKNALNGFAVFQDINTQHLIHFVFDTMLFLNALVNPCIILYFSDEVSTAVSMIF